MNQKEGPSGPKKPDVPNPNLRIEHLGSKFGIKQKENEIEGDSAAEISIENIINGDIEFTDSEIQAKIEELKEALGKAANDQEKEEIYLPYGNSCYHNPC